MTGVLDCFLRYVRNFHSRYEWTSVQDMEKAVEVIVNLAQVWGCQSSVGSR